MPNPKINVTEDLFEQFCQQEGIPFERIRESNERRPDYVLSLGKIKLIAEVKAIEPNAEEKAIIEAGPEEMDPEKTFHWGIPGERVRKKISEAVPQLKSYSTREQPTILILHDTAKFWPELLDSYAVMVAMYGVESIQVSSKPAPRGGASILRRWHGSRKKLTNKHNTSLSAVGILTHENSGIYLNVFHNWYAKAPLPPSVFNFAHIIHKQLTTPPTEDFGEWVDWISR